VQSAFAAAIVYVMLSRCCNRTNLFILGGLKPADFVPIMPALSAMTDAEQRHIPHLLRQLLERMEAAEAEAAR
jgi:hypothetical protein